MSFLNKLDLDELSPAALWSQLDVATREEAARSCYNDSPGGGKREANLAISKALSFRPAAVQQLPLDRRVNYLLKAVHVDDSLAATILLALHLDKRQEILAGFLDELGIPQSDGLISEDYDLQPPQAGAIDAAAKSAYERFDAEHVDLYFAALLALDSETWTALRPVLNARRDAARG